MDVKYIEIKFEYQESIVTIKSEPYKTIKELKEKAIKKFHNIPKDIHCFYLARDLESYENIIIGEFFNNREKVTLKLMPKKKPIFPIKKKLNNKEEELLFSDIYLNTKVFSSGFNNIGRFNNNKLKNNNSLDIKEKKKKNKGELLLPPIKNKSSGKKEKNKEIFTEYELNIDKFDEINEECQNCHNNNFSEYCRNCKEFVCSNCKKNNKHQNHLFIHLDSNYESNIKIYGNLLLTDIEYFKTNNNNINKNENIINNCTSLLNIQKLYTRQNDLINKLKDIINMYETVINQIKNELINEGETKIKDLINIYNNNSIKINEDINNLLKQLEMHKDKINMKEFKYFFEQMSEKEEKLNNINKNIIKFHLTSQINNKIVSMLNKIELIINETIVEKNNPFNLSPNFSEELTTILNKNKKIKVIDNINRNFKKSKTSRYQIEKTINEENINNS